MDNKTWEELTISDDFMFKKVMQNVELCKELLETILNIKIRDIHYPEEEKSIDIQPDAKSIRLDVLFTPLKTAARRNPLFPWETKAERFFSMRWAPKTTSARH